jgi:RNA polymerase sigma-70 factor (ECF subfamily)
MPASPVHPVLRLIRRLSVAGAAGSTPDAQLLDRFVGGRDETAFAALVRRHGPMVLGVCVRVLGDTPDAEDAFQATFLVLLRRAHSVSKPELLGNWLYGVAYRTALKARVSAARRRRHESQGVRGPGTDSTPTASWRDLQPVLDDELNRLPQKYRLPLVLCHLEGLTHDEIARRLGCPRATVTTRLGRARERLRRSMIRRGVTLATGALITGFGSNTLVAAVSPALLERTAKVTSSFGSASVSGLVSVQVEALTEGVLQAMLLSRLKIAMAFMTGIVVVVCGVGVLALNTISAAPTRESREKQPVPATEITSLAKEDAKDGPTVKEMPPAVIRTTPQAGDTQVDAGTVKEIRVTFSKEMEDDRWSWSQISDETFPKTAGKPHYEKDRRTCILPVKLEPGKTYVLWLNSEKFGNFKDTGGHSAIPYLLVFETKP